MDDFSAVEIRQPVQYPFGHLAQHLLSGSTTQFLNFLVYTVQTTSFAEFHCDRDRTRRLVHERAVVTADMVGCTVFVEIKLSNDLLLHVRVGVRRDDLVLISAVTNSFSEISPSSTKTTHLESEDRLSLLQFASSDRTTGTFT